MLGMLSLLFYMLMGVAACWALLPSHAKAIRAYLGMVLGLVLMMWLPSLCAFSMGFTREAQFASMGLALLIAVGAWAFRWFGKAVPMDLEDPTPQHPPLRLTLLLLVPILIASGYLLHTHMLREVDGALHVGQSTFGDLSLHLGIATGLRNASYPPEYTLLPGTLLGYPFLADAMAASMLMLGTSLRWSFILTSLAMMGLTYWGFILLAWTLTKSRRATTVCDNTGYLTTEWTFTNHSRATAVAFLLLFLNGGLGFLYMLDGLPSDPSRFLDIFSGFYMTPTNLPDLNLRWVNVLCDLMLPQRTLLAGWMMVIPSLLLLYHAIRTGRRSIFIVLGVWAGLMPMVHTHSFLALGLISLGAMIYALFHAVREERAKTLQNFLYFGGIAVLLALPQLLLWTLPQTLGGQSLGFRFNWVNWDEDSRTLIDGYFWFWIKNVGLLYLLMVPSAIRADPQKRALALGALCVYVLAELIQFQPNPYDNNKLFYVAFILMVPLCASYLEDIYDRLSASNFEDSYDQRFPGRRLIAGAFLFVSLFSGALTLGRELVSDYELFSAQEAQAAQYVDQHASADAVFVTGTQHNNPIASLAGRRLVCGTPTFLYYHGVDYTLQQSAVRDMYERPLESIRLFEKYKVDYVYISNYERGEFDIDEAALAELFEPWFQSGDVSIFQTQPES